MIIVVFNLVTRKEKQEAGRKSVRLFGNIHLGFDGNPDVAFHFTKGEEISKYRRKARNEICCSGLNLVEIVSNLY